MSKWLIVAVVCALLLVIGLGAVKINVGPLHIGGTASGEPGLLTSRGWGENIPIFPDEQALVDLLRASARHDDAGANAILDRAASRGAFVAHPGTKVQILARQHPSPRWETVNVRIVEGEAAGKTGWTLADVVNVVH